MDVCHQQLGAADEFTMLLPLDGSHGNLAAFFYAEAVGLSGIHLGMGSAVTVQCTFADLRVDTPRDEKSDVDVVVLQLQRLVKAEQSMFSCTIG